MLFARILHVIGNILWLGGGAVAALAMAQLASASKESQQAAAQVLRKAVLMVVTPGMMLGLGAGLFLLMMDWPIYAKQPWMHAKLTVGLIAAGFSGVLTGKLRRTAASGAEVPAGSMRIAGWALVLSAIANVFFVFTRFGAN